MKPLSKKIPLKLGAILGISPQAINKWNRGLTRCPIHIACKIHDLTEGKIRVADVRPDLKRVIPYMVQEFESYLRKIKL